MFLHTDLEKLGKSRCRSPTWRATVRAVFVTNPRELISFAKTTALKVKEEGEIFFLSLFLRAQEQVLLEQLIFKWNINYHWWVFLNFDLTERLFFNCLIFTLSVNLKTKSIFHVKKILLDQYHFALIRACSRDTKIVIDSLVHIIAFLLFPF